MTIYPINETHDIAIKSWVETANEPGTDFPIQNLPFGAFRHRGATGAPQIGIAIGGFILNLTACDAALFDESSRAAAAACKENTLNKLMSLGRPHWSALRKSVHDLLRSDSAAAAQHKETLRKHLVPMTEAEMLVPAAIGDYSDFYASVFHATNVGKMFRPNNPLMPNYKYVPIAYHGRASSIVISGTAFRRPNGQGKDESSPQPTFGPSKRMDYETEVAFFIGPGNELGSAIPLPEANDHIFGLCLLNDWSARDIQAWEYQPLGPFLAKSFVSTISPWIVTLEALEPYRCPALNRPADDPKPLPYLASAENEESGGLDLTVDVLLSSEQMRQQGKPPLQVSRVNLRDLYWTLAQMVTHHASNGCNLRPGDMVGSGTISGEAKGAYGSLLELTAGGAEPLRLPTGEIRKFLEDGDEMIFRGSCEKSGFARIGFGECRGRILPAARDLLPVV